MKKGMKKFLTGITIIVLLAFLCYSRRPYHVISGFVQNNEEELERLAEDVIYERYTDYQYKSIDNISYFPGRDTDIVQFYYPRMSLFGTMEYYGFYYSTTGKPVSDQNSGIHLKEEAKNIWSWQAPGNEGNGKTILITENWYYFESAY